MHYAIIAYETDSELAARTDPKRVESYWAAYTAYSRALVEAGIARGGAGLQPPADATTVRLRAGKRQVQDGPFADTKERLGGFFLIEVPDLDKALEWAARCPAASTGSVEVAARAAATSDACVSQAAEIAARAARESYGRLLAIVAGLSRDIASAEDALAEAFASALAQWPASGVPTNPEAWLLTAARRRLEDSSRKSVVRAREAPAVEASLPTQVELATPGALPDDRLRLLFVCAHPALEAAIQPALMLQTVLGLDARTIASAFRVAPKTLGQRLWRAKVKVREAGIAFEVPEAAQLTERLGAVLEAIYAAFGSGWEDVERGGEVGGLVEEALFLARLLVTLLPNEPEPQGLLALMLFAEARRPARRSPEGAFVPLEQQDTARWSRPMLDEADRLLHQAFARHRPGPWQLEAAIQSVHVVGGLTGRRDVRALVDLYDGLVHFAPSLGALVGRGAALLEAAGPEAALQALDALEASSTDDYQPYWVVRAHALERAGRSSQAREAYERAIGLTEDAAVRRHLLREAAKPPTD